MVVAKNNEINADWYFSVLNGVPTRLFIYSASTLNTRKLVQEPFTSWVTLSDGLGAWYIKARAVFDTPIPKGIYDLELTDDVGNVVFRDLINIR